MPSIILDIVRLCSLEYELTELGDLHDMVMGLKQELYAMGLTTVTNVSYNPSVEPLDAPDISIKVINLPNGSRKFRMRGAGDQYISWKLAESLEIVRHMFINCFVKPSAIPRNVLIHTSKALENLVKPANLF